MNARQVAANTLTRIERQGAFANLVLDAELKRSALDAQDRRFATQLVYGTTRMRRACDFLVDRFAMRDIDPPVRTVLRLGAYQLHFLSTPDHAAVDATVSLAPRKARGFVNAILRKVASSPVEWPNEAVRLSYPDWLVDLLVDDHGAADAIAMLERMNQEPSVHERADGYIQDPASQWVCDLVDAQPGERVLDLCAAPGGKATLIAASGPTVIAADRRLSRARLVASNAKQTQADLVHAVVADGTAVPYPPAAFDRVLVDAPCSGLGVLRRRADARWRIDLQGIDRLQRLQRELLTVAADLVRPGGRLVYSLCTVTRAETLDVVSSVEPALAPNFEPLPIAHAARDHTGSAPGSTAADQTAPSSRWRPWGSHGGVVLPQDHDSDGMSVFVWRRRSSP